MEAGDNDDGRKTGEWKSAYEGAHGQICCECFFLVVVNIGALLLLWLILRCVVSLSHGSAICKLCNVGFCENGNPALLLVLLYFVSGVMGGAAFATKWLYHSVARRTWHKDRLLWRLCVPLNGGVLAIFVTFIFAKTFGITFSKQDVIMPTIAQLAGFSFLIGVFADGVLAMLERLARNIFGTLESLSGK